MSERIPRCPKCDQELDIVVALERGRCAECGLDFLELCRMLGPLRIIVRIEPWGVLSGKYPAEVYFDDQPQHLSEITRGEGQALEFILIAADISPDFADALKDGRVVETFSGLRWTLWQGDPTTA